MSFNDDMAAAAADIVATLATGTISVEQRTGGTLNKSTGVYSGQTTVLAADVSAIRAERVEGVLTGSFGAIGTDEVMYAVLASALATIDERAGNWVVDNGQERRVTRVDRGMNGAIVGLVCRSDRRE